LEDKDKRKDAGTETRPFLSILLTNVDKNNAIQSHFSLFMGYHGMAWESMGFYRNPLFYLRLFYVYCNKNQINPEDSTLKGLLQKHPKINN
jgi:hypothetical protein